MKLWKQLKRHLKKIGLVGVLVALYTFGDNYLKEPVLALIHWRQDVSDGWTKVDQDLHVLLSGIIMADNLSNLPVPPDIDRLARLMYVRKLQSRLHPKQWNQLHVMLHEQFDRSTEPKYWAIALRTHRTIERSVHPNYDRIEARTKLANVASSFQD